LKAKRENYRSRAAYKLLEILEKYNLVNPDSNILDLGSAPGSWLQVLVNFVGKKGLVVGVDLKEVVPIEGTEILLGDIRDPAIQEKIRRLAPNGFDSVFSDLAPSTTGVHHADTGNSTELVHLVLDICSTMLKPEGNFAAKVFEGGEYKELHSRAKSMFEMAKSFKPSASLSESREIYLIGKKLKKKIL